MIFLLPLLLLNFSPKQNNLLLPWLLVGFNVAVSLSSLSSSRERVYTQNRQRFRSSDMRQITLFTIQAINVNWFQLSLFTLGLVFAAMPCGLIPNMDNDCVVLGVRECYAHIHTYRWRYNTRKPASQPTNHPTSPQPFIQTTQQTATATTTAKKKNNNNNMQW